MNEERGHNHFQRILELATPLSGVRLGLSRIKRALEQLGQPQRSFRSLIVAGTNGKGSTANFLAALLQASGQRVGLYTSPHLQHYEERFRIDGLPARPEEIAQALEILIRALGLSPRRSGAELPLTYFELTTLIAFLHFQRRAVQTAVLEVGVGGRHDATNAADAELAILCTVGLDHQELLGSDLRGIAYEKLGVARPAGPLICGVRQPGLREYIVDYCAKREIPLQLLDRDFHAAAAADGRLLYRGQRRCGPWTLPLAGVHQLRNAALALRAAECLEKAGWRMAWPLIPAAWAAVRWPARLEIFPGPPEVILDGCHNPEGAQSLHEFLEDRYRGRRGHLLFALSATKDAAGILQPLAGHFSTLTASQYSWEKSRPAGAAAEVARGFHPRVFCQPRPEAALKDCLSRLGPGEYLAIAGSLYFAGEIRPQLLVALGLDGAGEKPTLSPSRGEPGKDAHQN